MEHSYFIFIPTIMKKLFILAIMAVLSGCTAPKEASTKKVFYPDPMPRQAKADTPLIAPNAVPEMNTF